MALADSVVKQLDPQVRSYIEDLEQRTESLSHENEQLTQQTEFLSEEIQSLEEKLQLALFKRFGRSSERSTVASGQADLFSEADDTVAENEESETKDTVTVAAHTKKKPGRKAIDPALPRFERVIEISDEDTMCACGHQLVRIGEEVTERVQVIPEQIWVDRIVRPKYACKNCEGSGDESKPAVRIAPVEPTVVPKGIATASLIAFILANKFVDHLPFYRQEKRFERIGITISRQDMSNWTVRSAELLQPLIDRFRTLIRGGPVVNIDDTRVQVMNEPDRADTANSFMWLARGGPPESPVTLYSYSQTRSTTFLRSLLSGATLYLQGDAYRAHETFTAEEPGITRVGCYAHARRKFHEAAQASKKTGAAHEGLKYISQLYQIERELRDQDLSDDEFLQRRREHIEPVFERFHRWLLKKKQTVVPSSLIGKAVNYTLDEWSALIRYIEHPALTPDNNAAENAIRPFVLGRKNWLFSGSPNGAAASCAIYSLIETAKQNDLNPFAYLYYALDRAPRITSDADWDELLPSNLTQKIISANYPIPGRLV
jgi:transposase